MAIYQTSKKHKSWPFQHSSLILCHHIFHTIRIGREEIFSCFLIRPVNNDNSRIIRKLDHIITDRATFYGQTRPLCFEPCNSHVKLGN